MLHSGAYKTNITLGSLLLVRKIGKARVIAETGAGQHGVASGMAGALPSISVEVYMGSVGVARQAERIESLAVISGCLLVLGFAISTKKDVKAAFDVGADSAIIGGASMMLIADKCDDIEKAKQLITTLVKNCVKAGEWLC